jgi:LysR family glycine cleavage system transcriptional activator
MPRPLPPLNALRAFEAAARHRSIRRAALELHVTPAAISQQVKLLEDYLGVQLFQRVNRGLTLTPEAEASIARLREGFDALAGAVELMHAQHGVERVRVGAAPSFAGKWLAPRINGFCSAFPDTDVRIAADERFIDPRQPGSDNGFARPGAGGDDFDIAIRFGSGAYPGWRVDKLFNVTATPLCSPHLMEGEHPLRSPDDLRHHTLLHDDTVSFEQGGIDWNTWLKAAGVRDIDTHRGARFNHAVLGLEAAIDGAGVVLSYPVLASADLAQGRLIAPFDLEVDVDFAYYALSAEAPNVQPRVAAFRDWLLGQAGARAGVH